MQPRYITLTSTGSSPWQLANWHSTPQQFGFAVVSTGGSSWFIEVALEDPTGTYPNPQNSSVAFGSSLTTGFTILTGSSNQMTGFPSSFGSAPAIAGYRFTLNTISQANAKVTLVTIQSGIG